LELSVRTNSSDRFIFGEVFDHNYYRLEGFVPRTILDLGANVGFTAVYYSKWFPSAAIACVEPEPGNLKVLYHNMAMNGVRAKIFEAAISKSDGEETLSLSDQDYGHKIVDVETGDLPRSIRVKAIAVQTLLRELKWLKIDLLKIDIEGYETKLFQSGCNWLHQVDKMFIEWHETVQQAEVKLSELARQYGFLPPKLLPGIWLLEREADVHTAVLDGTSE
jgi:FkbM family methyltransferase